MIRLSKMMLCSLHSGRNGIITSFYQLFPSGPSYLAKTTHAHKHFLSPQHHALGLCTVRSAESASPTRSEKTTQASQGQRAREIHKKHKHLCTLCTATATATPGKIVKTISPKFLCNSKNISSERRHEGKMGDEQGT